MNEIKVGEYVRTKLGDIKKITEGFEFIIERYNKSENKIVKHSPNIIDLVEEGDYVNGHLVVDKYKDTDDYGKDFITIEIESDLMVYKSLLEKHIKSICTKEQFENISYKVEG